MLTKEVSVLQMKAGPDDGLSEGQFEAFVSVIGNKDSYGDVVQSGAFDDTLAEWAASGDPIPVIWSHGYRDISNHIGYLLDAGQKTIDGKTGLWVKGQLDIGDGPEDAVARKANRLLKSRRVKQFSFSYDVTEGAYVQSADLGSFYELRKLRLYEVGPCLIGANQETDLLAAKAADAARALAQVAASESKAGRVLSAKNEELLRTAHESIGSVLSTLDSEDGKAMADEPAKDEEPAGAKSEEPMRPAAADLYKLQSIELADLIGE